MESSRSQAQLEDEVRYAIASTSLVDRTSVLFDGRVSAEWTPGRGEAPADLTISMGRSSLRLPTFAEFGFEPSVGKMRPKIQLWESASIGTVIGLRHLAVVRFSARSVTGITALYRTGSDDTGWYSIEAIAAADGWQVLIYEGGVVAIDENGIIRWHRPKPWNDVCIAEADGQFRFLAGDDGEYLIAASTGVVTRV